MSDAKPVPDYVLVPREPTEEMRRAGMDLLMTGGYVYDRDFGTTVIETAAPRAIYRAMLAAAPSGWISVEERLPEDEGRYLIHYRYKDGLHTARTFIGDWLPVERQWMVLPRDCTVTHWMPLPAPPAAATKGSES